jgi:hypothetical protein
MLQAAFIHYTSCLYISPGAEAKKVFEDGSVVAYSQQSAENGAVFGVSTIAWQQILMHMVLGESHVLLLNETQLTQLILLASSEAVLFKVCSGAFSRLANTHDHRSRVRTSITHKNWKDK